MQMLVFRKDAAGCWPIQIAGVGTAAAATAAAATAQDMHKLRN